MERHFDRLPPRISTQNCLHIDTQVGGVGRLCSLFASQMLHSDHPHIPAGSFEESTDLSRHAKVIRPTSEPFRCQTLESLELKHFPRSRQTFSTQTRSAGLAGESWRRQGMQSCVRHDTTTHRQASRHLTEQIRSGQGRIPSKCRVFPVPATCRSSICTIWSISSDFLR